MKKTEKQAYVTEWRNYIKPLYALCFNGDKELEQKMAIAVDTLYNEVPNVADNKIKHSKGDKK